MEVVEKPRGTAIVLVAKGDLIQPFRNIVSRLQGVLASANVKLVDREYGKGLGRNSPPIERFVREISPVLAEGGLVRIYVGSDAPQKIRDLARQCATEAIASTSQGILSLYEVPSASSASAILTIMALIGGREKFRLLYSLRQDIHEGFGPTSRQFNVGQAVVLTAPEPVYGELLVGMWGVVTRAQPHKYEVRFSTSSTESYPMRPESLALLEPPPPGNP